MVYGRYQGRYGGPGQTSQGMGSGPIFAVGLIMLAVGAVVVIHALAGGVRLPPASAQQIPATVSTAVPFPVDPSKVAPPLPPSTPVLIEIPAVAVEAPVMRLGRNSDGTVQVPPLDDHNLAGWYDGSPTPGQKGSSVDVDLVAPAQGLDGEEDRRPGVVVDVSERTAPWRRSRSTASRRSPRPCSRPMTSM